jgi:hypothetical protein
LALLSCQDVAELPPASAAALAQPQTAAVRNSHCS